MSERGSVYLLGIGGIAMANVAVLLRSSGYEVTGSDQSIYEPAASLLKRAGIPTKTPYAIENLPTDSKTFVIVGNVHSRGQIEVEEALRRNLMLESFPGFLRRSVMADKCRVVVAGTHGKSTTSACCAHLLNKLNRDPSYLIGADPIDLDFGGHKGSGSEFVIEGDEYDSAFFDKRSKFLDYFPQVLILGRVEHDHLDIFPALDEMMLSYRRLVGQLPSNGTLVVASDSPLAMELAEKSPCQVVTVSNSVASDYCARGNVLRVPAETVYQNFAPRVIGDHNFLNVAMAIAGIASLGIPVEDVVKAAQSFRGIKRRLELLFESEKHVVYDDFAHHPTAIAAAIDAVKQRHPDRNLVAVFEPRSNTAVRRKYQNEFRDALAQAHMVVVGSIHRKEKIPVNEVLDKTNLVADLTARGVASAAIENNAVSEFLVKHTANEKHAILFMSNGSFGGAITQFASALKQEKITA